MKEGCSTGCPTTMDQASLTYWAWLQASRVADKVSPAAIAAIFERATVTRLRSPIPEPDTHGTRLAVGPRVIGNSRYPGGRGLRIPFAWMHGAVETVIPPCARRGGPCFNLQYGHASK